jgi:tetratricopeptide (TPR) repeat protein
MLVAKQLPLLTIMPCREGGLVRYIPTIFLSGIAIFSQPAAAADALKFGKPPEWVVPQAIPAPDGKSPNSPMSLLLTDQQVHFEPGKTIAYSEVAMKLQTPEGLAAGNISLPWNPATDTITVNKLVIRRGTQVIDVLGSGQTFTTMRRETNLELAMLDGVLTANIQPEGLQRGDIIDLAVTIEHADPVFGNHVESNFMEWNRAPIELAHLRLDWPDTLPLKVQTKGFPASPTEHGGHKVIEITARDLEPVIPPKNAPMRFSVARLGEATDYASWADLATAVAPLYRKAEAIPASGPLHDEVEKIRTSTADPKIRAAKALRLVQDRIRYLALAMGNGGYVPADAEITWSRRFGDCKAKTALLLGILHSLGIEAEPILVNAFAGDAIAERLPMVGLFNHVLVRAHVAGKIYFLDGTRTEDSDLDSIRVPYFDWGLPLLPDAKLIAMVPPALDQPSTDTKLVIDATKGVRAEVGVTAERILYGDQAVDFNTNLGALTDAQRADYFDEYWKTIYDFVTPGPTTATFNAIKRTLSLSMTGTGKLDWTTGYFHLPDTTLGFSPSYERPPGPSQDAPVSVSYPAFTHDMVTVRFPPGFFGKRPSGVTPTTDETLAGVEYRMTATNTSGLGADTLSVQSSERSLAPEISYADAVAATQRLRELSDQDVATPLPRYYRPTKADLDSWLTEKTTTVDGFLARGNALMDARRYDDAVHDFTRAIELDPKSVSAFSDRALAYLWKNNIPAAEKDIAAAKAQHMELAVLWRAQALLADQKGDTSGEINLYTQSLKDEPENSFALVHRALAFADAKQFDRADQDLRAVETALGSTDETLLYHAQIAAKREDFQSAIDLYTKALAKYPGDSQLLNGRASAFHSLHQDDRALSDSAAALAVTPSLVGARLLRANIFRDRGDLRQTLAEADALAAQNADSDYAQVGAGRIYAAVGAADKALKCFDRAIAIQPAAYIFLNRAAVRSRLDFAAQLADIEAAQALEPESRDVLAEKALLLLRQGKYSEALASYDAALKDNADSMPETSAERAVALFKAGRIAEANQAFQKLESNSNDASTWRSLCWTKASNGVLLDSALQDCRQALKLDPTNSEYLGSLGFVLMRLGRLDEALEAYNSGIAKSVGPFLMMGRALVRAQKGDRSRAIRDHEAAKKLDPAIDERFAIFGLKFEEAAGSAIRGH